MRSGHRPNGRSAALRTTRFWLIALAYFLALIAWYAVQVHQTKYLVEIGFPPLVAAWALGAVAIIAIPGQILLGALSDRIGREWVWTIACFGFVFSYLALLGLEVWPSSALLYFMVFVQGFLGYALTSVMGPIVAEVFQGPHYGSIFGTISIGLVGGGAAGPWIAGAIHDATGSYRPRHPADHRRLPRVGAGDLDRRAAQDPPRPRAGTAALIQASSTLRSFAARVHPPRLPSRTI